MTATGTRPKARSGDGNYKQQKHLGATRYRWKWRILATLPDGRKKTLLGRFDDTYREVREYAQAEKRRAEITGGAQDRNPTVAAHLADWLAVKATEVRPKTLRIYADLVRLHINPRIGGLPLQALLLRSYTDLSAQTDLERGRSQIHNVLHQALDHAVRLGLIGSNPAKSVKPAPVKRVRVYHDEDGEAIQAWTPDQARALFAAALAAGRPFGWATSLGLRTGLRKGGSCWACSGGTST